MLEKQAGTVAKATFKENLPAAARFAKRAAKQGVDDVALHLLMESSDCLKYGDDVLKSLGKLEPLSQTKAAGVLKEHADTLVNVFSKTEVLDDAVKFIADYSDDGAILLFRYGDDAIAAVKGCDAPYKAVQIIKDGGLQYGEQAVQAIKKSGDKAVEALTKVPTKECAEVITSYGDDGANYIIIRDEYAVQSYASGITSLEAEKTYIDNLFGSRCNTHFNTIEDFNKKRQGIIGGHSLQVVQDYSQNTRLLNIINKTKIYDGVYTLEYQAAALDTKTNLPIYIDGQIQYVRNGYIYEKTVVDLNEISYSQIEQYAKEAFFNQQIVEINDELYIKGIASNGIKFEGWLENGELKSFYPVDDWQY